MRLKEASTFDFADRVLGDAAKQDSNSALVRLADAHPVTRGASRSLQRPSNPAYWPARYRSLPIAFWPGQVVGCRRKGGPGGRRGSPSRRRFPPGDSRCRPIGTQAVDTVLELAGEADRVRGAQLRSVEGQGSQGKTHEFDLHDVPGRFGKYAKVHPAELTDDLVGASRARCSAKASRARAGARRPRSRRSLRRRPRIVAANRFPRVSITRPSARTAASTSCSSRTRSRSSDPSLALIRACSAPCMVRSRSSRATSASTLARSRISGLPDASALISA